MNKWAWGYLLSIISIFATTTVLAEAPPKPVDCVTVEATDGYSLLTNKCSDTVNVRWFYAGECASGCSVKLSAKYHQYQSLFKDPYTIAACYAPKDVDAAWKGTGPAECK